MKKVKYAIKHKVSKYRRDKRTGATQPVRKSEYFKELEKIGAGWKDE